jgi:cephalosporin hydroxylase
MTPIEALYQARLTNDSHHDMREHLPTLRRYAELCPRIVEFGTRTGNSTTAFLAGGAQLFSYDIADAQFKAPTDVAHRWVFTKQDTTQLAAIPACDFLFLDSRHTEDQVRAELRMHVHASRFLGLHDTIEWGTRGEGGGPGIIQALFPFLADHSRTWRVSAHFNNCCGLTILERIGS